MGAIHALRVESPYKLLKIEDIKIENKPNQHGYLYLKCLIDDSINFDATIKASTDDKISVYEELEDKNKIIGNDKRPVNINEVDKRNSIRLFYGIVQNHRTTNTDGVYYLEIEALTSSFEMDIKEKSRSFQNAEMTYDELIQAIMKDYPNYMYSQIIGKGQKIGKPLFQFKETDWNFLKRIASELKAELYSDVMEVYDLFYFGRPNYGIHEVEDMKRYKACKELQIYRDAGGDNAGYHSTDYFYYELERKEQYNVGDDISFRDKKFYVNEYSAYAIKDEIIYKYKLCRKNGVWQTKLYNSNLQGASLEGKVIDREEEKVKLHLNIDKEQDKEEAAWFTFAPPTGDVMYCMPIIGTSARLYFPNESSEEPIVTGCVRNNGSGCQKTSDTTKRYLGTEHGSEVEMTPNALNIRGKEPVSISFDDNVGVTITTHKKLTINADDDIIMKTPKNVKVNATSQLFMKKAGTRSGFSMETDIHFLSNNMIRNGRDREAFAPIDNTPPPNTAKQQQETKKEEKKPFSWGKLAFNVLAGLAVVAAVTIAAVAIASTAGLAGPVLGAIAMGGGIAGTLAVGGKAVSDIKSGKVSDTSEYVMLGAKEAFVGAVTSAIFAPFIELKALGATGGLIGEIPTAVQRIQGLIEVGVLGGTYNVTYNYISNALDGKIPNAQEVLESFKNGALLGAYFHVGGEALSKASPFINNAFSKVSSELSDNLKALKYAWDNVEVPKDIKLGSNFGNIDLKAGKDFVNKYKEGLEDIKNGSEVGSKAAEEVKYGNQYTRVDGKKVLKSNVEYTTKEGYKYKTNSSGDIEEVEGTLKLGDGKRSLYAQRTVGGDYRLLDDDGGHLIGSQFLGSGKIDNLVPMNSQINRAGGRWYNMETEWANALKEGKDVQVKIQNIYEPNNSRPVSFKIKYTIEGEKTKIIKILNKSGG